MKTRTKTTAVETPYGIGFVYTDIANIERFVETPMPDLESFEEGKNSDYNKIWIRELGNNRRLVWATYWSSDSGYGYADETGIDYQRLPEHYGWNVAKLFFEEDTERWGWNRETLVEACIPAYANADEKELERIAAYFADIAYRETLSPSLNGVDIISYAFSPDAMN